MWYKILIQLAVLIPLFTWPWRPPKAPSGWERRKNRQKVLSFLQRFQHPPLLEKGWENLPRYKFYTDLLLELRGHLRKYGVPLTPTLRSLREGLTQDDQFERKVARDQQEALVQFLFLTGIIWIFILFSRYQLDLVKPTPLSVPVLTGIAICHFAGVGIFLGLANLLKKNMFRHFPLFFRGLYSFPALLSVGVPFSEARAQSGLDGIFECKDPGLLYVQERLGETLEDFQKRGGSLSEPFQEMLKEVWFLLDEAYEKYAKRLKVLRFLVLILFYLGTYFFYLSSLVGLFMASQVFP